jgi:transposase-like protein
VRKIVRFIIWICSKFTREEIEEIVAGLVDVLADRNPDVKPRDDFRQKHPHYRRFAVDPTPPLTAPPEPQRSEPTENWRDLLAAYEAKHGRPLPAVKRRTNSDAHVPAAHTCAHCGAPSQYLYFNDGEKRTQFRCKVCQRLSAVERRRRKTLRARHWCPYCQQALYRWKSQQLVTLYKCPNNHCPAYLRNLAQLNPDEKRLRKTRSSQFTVRYIYREYHFRPSDLQLPAPNRPRVDLARVHSPDNVIGLALAFHISFGIGVRKTAAILRDIFGIPISYQTVSNYCEAAAYHCHRFNLDNKTPTDARCPGDETYIKIAGKWAYTFLFLGATSRTITAYHVADARDTRNATVALNEVVRTAPDGQTTEIVVDGNNAYTAAVHFINQPRLKADDPAALIARQVIGLQNLDDDSERYRPFKQMIERLNRTYKFHARSACGFSSWNGALAFTALFVTHYNFLRPHTALNRQVPVPLDELRAIPTLQARWCKILDLAMTAPQAA